MDVYDKNFLKQNEQILFVLEFDDIKSNCDLCPSPRKLVEKVIKIENIRNIFDKGKVICKHCLVSISKRKMVYQYIKEYFTKFHKNVFTLMNLKKYIKNCCPYHPLLVNSVKWVVRDMLINNVIKRDSTTTKIRYVLLQRDFEIEQEVIKRAFGNEYGIKQLS